MKYDTISLEEQLSLAFQNMSIEDLVEVINRSLSRSISNDKEIKCPRCKSLLQELPSKRLSAQELTCPSCNYACLHYRGICRTINKKVRNRGFDGNASIRCYDPSGLERFIELETRSVSEIEMKSKDEFSLLLPLPNSAPKRGYAAVGPGVFNNLTVRSSRELGDIKIRMFDEHFPMLGVNP